MSAALHAQEKAHAKFSASGSKRWLECAASIPLSLKAPPGKESRYSAEGTRAHSALDYLIKNRKNRLAAAAVLRKTYPTEMVVHCEAALDYIEKRLAENPGAKLLSEIRVDLPVSEPGQFGTTDIAIIDEFGRLIVMDFKYGAGVIVDVENNSQGIYYALGIAHKYDYNFSVVEIVIIQPRAWVNGAAIRTWETTVENLLHWREVFEAGIKICKTAEKAAARGEDLSPYLKSGDHCQFCPAKIGCPEIKNKALREAQAAFDDEKGLITTPPMKELDLPVVLPALEKLEKWIKAVRDHATEVLESGGEIKGYGLVEAKGQRRWTDIQGLLKAIEKAKIKHLAFSTPELLSPAQLEKEAKGFKVDQFCKTISSGNKSLKKVEKEVFADEEVVKTKQKPKRK